MTLELSLVLEKRETILDIAYRHKIHSISVFGSVARGESNSGSDLDILFEIDRSLGLFPIIRMESELETIFGVKVDVCPKFLLKPEILASALKDAIRL